MSDFAIILQLLSLPASIIVIAAIYPYVARQLSRQRDTASFALYLLSLLLVLTWIVLQYQAGVRADETRGGGGSLFDLDTWLIFALIINLLAVATLVTGSGKRQK